MNLRIVRINRLGCGDFKAMTDSLGVPYKEFIVNALFDLSFTCKSEIMMEIKRDPKPVYIFSDLQRACPKDVAAVLDVIRKGGGTPQDIFGRDVEGDFVSLGDSTVIVLLYPKGYQEDPSIKDILWDFLEGKEIEELGLSTPDEQAFLDRVHKLVGPLNCFSMDSGIPCLAHCSPRGLVFNPFECNKLSDEEFEKTVMLELMHYTTVNR